ncbi:PEP-CTERM sorting domain-containing protein [Thiobacillus sp.]
MNAFYRCAALLGIALVTAQAQAVDFSFTPALGTLTQGNGNSYTDTVSGLTITASAWSNANRAGKFQTATLNVANSGLGVCTGLNCTTGVLDNSNGGSDMILFSFSSAVNLQSLGLEQFDSDSDLSVWAGTGSTFSPNNKKPTKLGTASLIDNSNSVAGFRNVSLAAFTGSYDWIAVGARIGQINDFATLKSLTINPVAQPVPEATTWMTMLAGLGLVGFAVSRRTRT